MAARDVKMPPANKTTANRYGEHHGNTMVISLLKRSLL